MFMIKKRRRDAETFLFKDDTFFWKFRYFDYDSIDKARKKNRKNKIQKRIKSH